MADCKSRWLDVFVTKPDIAYDKQEYTFDDQFVCSVQSVRIDHSPRELSTPENSYAIITSQATDWIMPTWTKQYFSTCASDAHGAFKMAKTGQNQFAFWAVAQP